MRSFSAFNGINNCFVFCRHFISVFQILLNAFADSFFILLKAVLAAFWRAVVLIWSWIGGMAVSFLIAVINVY